MDLGSGAGKVAVLVTAETKQALKQLRDVSKQTKATAKTSNGLSKSTGAGVKKFGIIAVAALAVVTGGFYAMLRASSYADVYTKRWQAEQTMIANEWVRRHGSIFDRITEMYADVRMRYVGGGGSLSASIGEAIDVRTFGLVATREKNIERNKRWTNQINRVISTSTEFKRVRDQQTSEGSKRLLDYSTLWINTYIRPIHDFIKSIFKKVTEIVGLIPKIGINVEYNVFSGGGGDGGDEEEGGGTNTNGGYGGSWNTPHSVRSLGAI